MHSVCMKTECIFFVLFYYRKLVNFHKFTVEILAKEFKKNLIFNSRCIIINTKVEQNFTYNS